MPEVLDWQSAADPRQMIDRAAQALVEGQLVGFPTETVYGIAASAFHPDAVERLAQSKGRDERKPMALAISSAIDAIDWIPQMSLVGKRLARRCWPGPLTLVSSEGVKQGLARQLSESVRQRVCPGGTLGLRAPAHEAIQLVLRQVPGPLVLTSANRSGEPEAITAKAVVQSVGDHLALIISDDPSPMGIASTVVRVEGNCWKVVREGAVSAGRLEELVACMIVFVCTGNTCRSPLAEALCKKLLAERLNCRIEELPERGFLVLSAGLAAMMGGRAAAEAVAVAQERGADLSGHASRPLTRALAAQADYLIAMTHTHLQALTAEYDCMGYQPRLLSYDSGDVPDPIGGDEQVYRDCARQILAHLEAFLPEVLPR